MRNKRKQPIRAGPSTDPNTGAKEVRDNAALGPNASRSVLHERAQYSQVRLDELRRLIGELKEVRDFPKLTVFGAGSYARLEASKYSDIDMFFMIDTPKEEIPDYRTRSLRLWGKLIDIIGLMDFPSFSNDCEYLQILHTPELVEKLGGRLDDHENFFTTRMLLLLESKCLYGEEVFDTAVRQIISSYFKDYPDHKETFQPMFLMNDICRFWKTLLLNYENKRSTRLLHDQKLKTKQKVRNFKLKYSRMTTCFATAAALGSHRAPVTEEQVFALTKLTPRERLQSVVERIPEVSTHIDEVLDRYVEFLELTGLPTASLEAKFSDKQKRSEMFARAKEYGDAMFRLIDAIDAADDRLRLLRTLVI